MRLIEADGKRFLKQAGIMVSEGILFPLDTTRWNDQIAWDGPYFFKAQVLRGRRGLSGLVQRVAEPSGVGTALNGIRSALRDVPSAGVYCEREVPHQEEFFLSVDCDPVRGLIRVSASFSGGTHVTKAQSVIIDSDDSLDPLGLPLVIQRVAWRLVSLMTELDCLSIEINPLVITEAGEAVALDAKIELDNAAMFRHPEYNDLTHVPLLERALTKREGEYEALVNGAGHRGTFGHYTELDGDIALLLSGGGASLVALDALMLAGGRSANYVELSGNPDPHVVYQAAKIACSKPGIRAIWIAGSYANFTDINATVSQMLLAIEELGLQIPVVIRRDGPNVDAARSTALTWSERLKIPLRFFDSNTTLEESAHALIALCPQV